MWGRLSSQFEVHFYLYTYIYIHMYIYIYIYFLMFTFTWHMACIHDRYDKLFYSETKPNHLGQVVLHEASPKVWQNGFGQWVHIAEGYRICWWWDVESPYIGWRLYACRGHADSANSLQSWMQNPFGCHDKGHKRLQKSKQTIPFLSKGSASISINISTLIQVRNPPQSQVISYDTSAPILNLEIVAW